MSATVHHYVNHHRPGTVLQFLKQSTKRKRTIMKTALLVLTVALAHCALTLASVALALNLWHGRDVRSMQTGCTTDTECQCTDDCLTAMPQGYRGQS